MTEQVTERIVNAESPEGHHSRIANLRSALERDIDAADITWCLFVSAAQSYRYHSRLNPYPPRYATKEKSEYDIDRIRLTIDATPPFRRLLRQITDDHGSVNEDVIDLVHWVVCSKSLPSLRSVTKDKVKTF